VDVITREDLCDALASLDIHEGMQILVHASLKFLGWVEGGADTVIDAILSSVGPSGVVMMPTFTFPPAPVFDPSSTPTSLGIIAETFWRRSDTVRSIHPSHSVAVWGKDNQRYADAHERATALGIGSPVHLLIKEGADILLLGVGHWANSAIHVAEALAHVPYLDIPYSVEYSRTLFTRLADGSLRGFPPHENPGCSINFTTMEWPVKKRGFIRYNRMKNALLQRVNGEGLLETATNLLINDPLLLLCSWELCPYCPKVRKMLKA
jgi:aminoglycoside 3-N-acetyltransferase